MNTVYLQDLISGITYNVQVSQITCTFPKIITDSAGSFVTCIVARLSCGMEIHVTSDPLI